jgi:hypothetical protein
MTVGIPQSEEVNSQLEDAGFGAMSYDNRSGWYRFKITSPVADKERAVLRRLIRQAWGRAGSGDRARQQSTSRG